MALSLSRYAHQQAQDGLPGLVQRLRILIVSPGEREHLEVIVGLHDRRLAGIVEFAHRRLEWQRPGRSVERALTDA
jgi:hypothetical protein